MRSQKRDDKFVCDWTRGHPLQSIVNRQRRARPWKIAPYGQWTLEDGTTVVFDRNYRPICQQLSDGSIVIVDPTKWIAFVDQSFFYGGMLDPVTDRATRDRVLDIVDRLGLSEELKRRRDLDNSGKLPVCAARPKMRGGA